MKHGQHILMFGLLQAAFLLVPGKATAQYFWNLPSEKALWALEMSVIYNSSDFDMNQAQNDQQTFVSKYFAGVPPSSVNIEDEWTSVPVWDIRLGLRFWHFIGGMNFSHNSGVGRRVTVDTGFMESSYDINISSKEFLFYLGYMQPLLTWLDVGVIGSIGPASAEANQKIQDSPVPYNNYWHKLQATYTSSRYEGRVRLHLTRYISLDFGAGYRYNTAENMKGTLQADTYGEPVLMLNKRAYEYAYEVPLSKPLVFDMSGMFYGVGITLKNPFD